MYSSNAQALTRDSIKMALPSVREGCVVRCVVKVKLLHLEALKVNYEHEVERDMGASV